jgi:Flp pilus assembly pilin Flp
MFIQWLWQAILLLPFTLHRDRRGIAAVDVILVLAAVSIPLVIVLVAFGNEIVDYLEFQVKRLE